MYYFFGCLIIPLIVLFVAKFCFNKTITWKEFGVSMAATVLVAAMGIGGWAGLNMMDSEVWNGYVTNKSRDRVSCEHSYSCNCRDVRSCSGSGENRSCSTHTECDTCYEHSYDVDWNVETTVGDMTIERVDRQGVDTPRRWSEVVIGEYAAQRHLYTNYVKMNRDSLFSYDSSNYDLFESSLPDYPDVTDYYRYNHVINMAGVDVSGWNEKINEYLRVNGASKQVNIIVITTTQPEIWSESLLYKWYGGKKNDVIMIYGFNKDNKTIVTWFKAVTFANGMNNQEMIIKLRNENIGSEFGVGLLKSSLGIIHSDYRRLSMSEMKYLRDTAVPPYWLLILTIILGIVTSVGTSYYFHKNITI